MENYLGEIRVFAGNYAPANWAFCKGQLLNISEYDGLFALIGTTYGGDGQTTFAVPNLQSRVAVGQGQSPQGSNYPVGTMGGVEVVTLNSAQMPAHQHPVISTSILGITGGTAQNSPGGAYFGNSGGASYAKSNSGKSLNPGTVTGQSTPAGGSQPHSNIQPVLALNYIIALTGIFPSFD